MLKLAYPFAIGFGTACLIWSIAVQDYMPKQQCPAIQLNQELISSSLDLNTNELLCIYQNNGKIKLHSTHIHKKAS